jgi:hypothetical protein
VRRDIPCFGRRETGPAASDDIDDSARVRHRPTLVQHAWDAVTTLVVKPMSIPNVETATIAYDGDARKRTPRVSKIANE